MGEGGCVTGVVPLKHMAGSASSTQDKCVICMYVTRRGTISCPSPASGAQHPLGLSPLCPSKPVFHACLPCQEKPCPHGALLPFFPRLAPVFVSAGFLNLGSGFPSGAAEERRIFICCVLLQHQGVKFPQLHYPCCCFRSPL